MNQNLINYFDKLHSSSNEEQVIENLKKILKNFNTVSYKTIIMSNPYFKSLVLDIKSDVITEMELMKRLIKLEIENLNSQLNQINTTVDFYKLKNLRRECVFMLNELENRQNDLYLLF